MLIYFRERGGGRVGGFKYGGFTLIEVLVVVSLLAILASMIIPSVNGAREAAKATICQVNLKNIHSATAQYSQDNLMYFPPAGTIDNKAWDDYLSDYDGRNLTQEEKTSNRLVVTAGNVGGTKMYLCPADTFERTTNHLPRSYGINAYTTGSVLFGVSMINQSKRFSEILNPPGMVAYSALIGPYNRMGQPGEPARDLPSYTGIYRSYEEDVTRFTFGVHYEDTFNYLFCDGRVERRLYTDFEVRNWRSDNKNN